MNMNKNLFAPSASFKVKCAQLTARAQEIDVELNSVISELKLAVADTLDKLSRVEKLNLVKKAVAA